MPTRRTVHRAEWGIARRPRDRPLPLPWPHRTLPRSDRSDRPACAVGVRPGAIESERDRSSLFPLLRRIWLRSEWPWIVGPRAEPARPFLSLNKLLADNRTQRAHIFHI